MYVDHTFTQFKATDVSFSFCESSTNIPSIPPQRELRSIKCFKNLTEVNIISYIGPDFTKLLERSEVEYRQANLTVAGMRADRMIYYFLPITLSV